MRYPSLDGQQRLATDPGMDVQPQPVSYWVDGLLAAVGADGVVGPDEVREIQRLMVSLEAIGAQKQAAMGGGLMPGPSGETSEFGSSGETEEMDGYGAEAGAEFTTRM